MSSSRIVLEFIVCSDDKWIKIRCRHEVIRGLYIKISIIILVVHFRFRNLKATVRELPKREMIDVPVDEMLIVELYSK